jgi:hypothetical protein
VAEYIARGERAKAALEQARAGVSARVLEQQAPTTELEAAPVSPLTDEVQAAMAKSGRGLRPLEM